MDEKMFKNDAKQIVDIMFDTKLLKEDVTRDGMNAFEDLIQFLLQSKLDSYQKIDNFLKSSNKQEIKNYEIGN